MTNDSGAESTEHSHHSPVVSSDDVTTTVCQLCGQPTGTASARRGETVRGSVGAGADEPFMLDPFDHSSDSEESAAAQESEATRAPRWSRRVVIGALLAIGIVGYGIGAFLSSPTGEEPDSGANELAEDAVFDSDEAGLFGQTTGDSPDSTDVDGQDADEIPSGDPNFPPSDEHLDADEISSLFTDRLGGDRDYAIAYVAEDGLHTLGSWGAAQPTVETAHTLDQALGNPLISDGSRTWAIDDTQPESAYIVSARFEVVETELSGNLAFIRKEEDRIEVGMTAYGGRQAGLRIPNSSDVLAVPGRGLLVTPATGGTFTVGANGEMLLLSEDRVVSAGLASEVYQRCDDTLTCELYASSVDADDVTVLTFLDFDADAKVTISPDGAHVAGPASGQGSLRLVGTFEESTAEFGDYSVLATGWAPDSSFLAVAVPGELLIVPVDGSDVLSIPLPADPNSDELLIFNL